MRIFTLLSFVLVPTLFAQSLTSVEQVMVKAIDQEADAAVALLERVVNINSGTFNPKGVKAVGSVFEAEFKSLGFSTRWVNQDAIQRGPHLVAERKGSRGKRLLLIGHFDTVFEPSSPFQKFEKKGGTAIGPGALDMKGGVVVMLSALKALHKAGALEGSRITVFLTGDEEAPGKPIEVSRKEFVEAGKNSQAALCFEGGARSDGKDYISTSRRGSTSWTLTVSGKTGHSSQVFSDTMGDGAIYELTRILNAFHEQLREPNLTYNVGMILGGSNIKVDSEGQGAVTGKPNIIPAEAQAVGDIRALTPEQLAGVKDKMHSILQKNLPKTEAKLSFSDSYPPMASTPGNIALLDVLNQTNLALGVAKIEVLDPMLRGAGDISFIAPFVDSISGLGANRAEGQGGSHAPGESIDLARLPLQSKRAALLIHRLIQ